MNAIKLLSSCRHSNEIYIHLLICTYNKTGKENTQTQPDSVKDFFSFPLQSAFAICPICLGYEHKLHRSFTIARIT